MELTRRRTLGMLLAAPLATLGLGAAGKVSAKNSPVALVRGHCAICRHYVPPKSYGFTIDGPPDAYCRHRHYCGDRYLCDDLVYELTLHRDPGDSCELFSVRENLMV